MFWIGVIIGGIIGIIILAIKVAKESKKLNK